MGKCRCWHKPSRVQGGSPCKILARERAGDATVRLALEVYGYRARKYLGAYSAVLGEVDALVFSGGVGENAVEVRERICAGLERLGIALDAEKNSGAAGGEREIGQTGMPVRVLVIPTDEELQIARETLAVARARRPNHPAAVQNNRGEG